MAKAKKGDKVKVHYTGKLKDGTEFDSSQDQDPLEFKLGEGNIIPGFEDAIIGMKEGEEKTEEIGADNAYGQYNKEYVVSVDRKEIPEDIDVKKGMQLEMKLEDGRSVPVMVREVKGDEVIIDANHPLAGKDLVFDIKLVEISS
jgi:peptidylprolyl isomerase